MLRFLQKHKAKKGFTILELIVVIAIIALMLAVILPTMSIERTKINEARSAAKDFYAALTTVLNYFSTYDGQLIDDDYVDTDVMRYYKSMNGNYPYDPDDHSADAADALKYPDKTVMYISFYGHNNTIENVRVVTRVADKNTNGDNGMFKLLSGEGAGTNFGEKLKKEIEYRVTLNEGYYYAKVVFNYETNVSGEPIEDVVMQTMKVEYTAYTDKKNDLSKAIPDGAAYDPGLMNRLFFGKDYVINWQSGTVCGTFASDGTGLKDTWLV